MYSPTPSLLREPHGPTFGVSQKAGRCGWGRGRGGTTALSKVIGPKENEKDPEIYF